MWTPGIRIARQETHLRRHDFGECCGGYLVLQATTRERACVLPEDPKKPLDIPAVVPPATSSLVRSMMS
jgi:hypothetical protein